MDLERMIDSRGIKLVNDYTMCMYRLQDQANLSYKEARAVLYDRWETVENIAKDFGISDQAVYNLIRRGLKKVEATGKNVNEIYGDYDLPFRFISPF